MTTENQFHQQLERSEQLNDLIIEIQDLFESVSNLAEKQDLLHQLKRDIEKL